MFDFLRHASSPPKDLLGIIRYVRARWRAKLAVKGAVRVFVTSVAVFFALAYAMQWARFTPASILAARLLLASAVVTAAYFFLVKPLRRRVTDDQVALYLEEKPLVKQPVTRRRARLQKSVEAGGHIFVPDHIEEDGVELFEACLERGLEGVVAKHRQSPYVPGQRSPFWLKVKAVKSDDFVVVGWMGERPYDALVVGFYEDGRLLPCGTVGGGWDDEAARFVRTRLAELASEASPLDPPPIMVKPVHWCRPELVVSVRYSEWSPDGTLRFPIFNSLRPEVHPAEAVRHRPRVVTSGHVKPGTLAYDLTRFPF